MGKLTSPHRPVNLGRNKYMIWFKIWEFSLRRRKVLPEAWNNEYEIETYEIFIMIEV